MSFFNRRRASRPSAASPLQKAFARCSSGKRLVYGAGGTTGPERWPGRGAGAFSLPWPLGVLLHVVQVGGHDEVFGVEQASVVSVLLPASVVALVRDVALGPPRLELPEVQPGLVVLQEATAQASEGLRRARRSYGVSNTRHLQPGVAQRLVHAEALPHLHLQQVIDQICGCEQEQRPGETAPLHH